MLIFIKGSRAKLVVGIGDCQLDVDGSKTKVSHKDLRQRSVHQVPDG